MTVHICDRCGDITVDSGPCTCATPYDPVEHRRRHRAAVESARASTGSSHVQPLKAGKVRRAA